ncbi:putative reverse transcriptase domain, reverse transcriptase zinc-binding domain protein [Tanacetum coccineum]
MKGCLSDLVNLNQSSFVPRRRISDNILLTQELMHNYHLDRGPARCAFKVDIQKAYDTVDWDFLNTILTGFGFHPHMIGWIMECVTSTSFSLSINGCLHGYFKGKRGLRQGDPLSTYLFTLVMEVFTLMLHRMVRQSVRFTFHRYCSHLNIINLCFVDDLFLFAHGDVDSARVIMDALDEFKTALGLNPKGTLLVKHLGVPLVPSRLVYHDCFELMERIKRRVNDWKNKSLSFAGRAQLIWFVLGFMHLYWASVFSLPSRLMLELEQVMRGFLWCQSEMKRGKAKVVWDAVCLPKREEGLGDSSFGRDGNSTSAWFHNWNVLSPLLSIISNRDIHRAGFSLDSKVATLIDHCSWTWPNEWYDKYPSLLNIVVPMLSEATDGLSWRNMNNMVGDFLVAKVWEYLKQFTCISNIPSDLNSIVGFITPLAKIRSIRSVIFKLVFAASCYFIWQERNNRLFKKSKRTHDQLIEIVKNNVWLKLLTCSFKKTVNVQLLFHI